MMSGNLLRCSGTRLPRRAGRGGGAGDPQGHSAQPAGLKVPRLAANVLIKYLWLGFLEPTPREGRLSLKG